MDVGYSVKAASNMDMDCRVTEASDKGLKHGRGLQCYRGFRHGCGYSVKEASKMDVDCRVTEASGKDVGYGVTEA
ncbi:hypothetical protein J6590_094060 [Homalodisca vitripennis]|nr:hypothetical protein J6590_094060 [Homalodisca vitripennis]